MRRMSDLPRDLVGEEIFSRVPLTSLCAVRSTCRTWNLISKTYVVGKKATAARKQLFVVGNAKVCSMQFDLNGNDFISPSIKEVSIYNQVDISKVFLTGKDICEVFHCDGLLLCLIKDKRWRVVWNPYSGQLRWIQPMTNLRKFHPCDHYAFGYANNNNNRDHKILRLDSIYRSFAEIYDFRSSSWRVLDVNPNYYIGGDSVCLKGNTYFYARRSRRGMHQMSLSNDVALLLCFDFTVEEFGPPLPMPFHAINWSVDRSFYWASGTVALSCVRDEQLAVLHDRCDDHIMKIWITTKIEPNVVSWSNFLKVDMSQLLTGFPATRFMAGTFFIDEERKVAVVSNYGKFKPASNCSYKIAYIIGEKGYFKSVNTFGQAPKPNKYGYCDPLVFSSYVPSLVQIQSNQSRKRKQRDD